VKSGGGAASSGEVEGWRVEGSAGEERGTAVGSAPAGGFNFAPRSTILSPLIQSHLQG
jgi:hypothetical protein